VSSDALPALRSRAVSLLSEGVFRHIELAAWNIELNDWVRMETLARVPKSGNRFSDQNAR
jgi:hypothetical protein